MVKGTKESTQVCFWIKKDSDEHAYKRARKVISRAKHRSYARNAIKTPVQKLNRYIKMLNSVQKNKSEIERKLSITRSRDINQALKNAVDNKEVYHMLRDFIELLELQLNNQFVYDKFFEEMAVVYNGQVAIAYVPSIVRKDGDTEFVSYFGGKGFNRSPLLVDPEGKVIYYWSKFPIRASDGIHFVNVRRQSSNSKRKYADIAFKQYLRGEKSRTFVTGGNRHDYLLDVQTNGAWIKLIGILKEFAKYRSQNARKELFPEYELKIYMGNMKRNGATLYM